MRHLGKTLFFSGHGVEPVVVIAVIVTVFCKPKNMDSIISLHAYFDNA